MEYYEGRLCVSYQELVDGGIMSAANYKQIAARGKMRVMRRGGGASGCCALVAVDSLPSSRNSILTVRRLTYACG